MTTTTVSQAIRVADTIITTGATLASGAFLNSGVAGAVNNIPSSGSTVSYDLMDVFINFGSVITTGTATTPTIQIAALDSPDGGTSFVAPGTVAAAAPPYLVQSFPFASGAGIGPIVELPNVQIRPYEFLSLFQNNLGVSWPAGTVITAVRKTIQNW